MSSANRFSGMRRFYLLGQLLKRDLLERYMGSLAGLAWSVLHPLVLVVLYVFVFTWVFKARPVAGGALDFAAFVLCGLLAWIALQESVSQSASSLIRNATLIKRIPFPAEILPVAVTLSGLVHQLAATLVFVAVLHGALNVTLTQLPLLPLLWVLQWTLTLGLCLLVASLNVFVRDIQHLVHLSFSLLFWMTPLVYDPAMVPARVRWLLELNPLTHLVLGYRRVFLGQPGPSLAGWLFLAGAASAVLAFGLLATRRLRGRFADFL